MKNVKDATPSGGETRRPGNMGGARKGAGRKKGGKNPATISKELAREALRQIVLREMDALVRGQIAQAKGLQYLVARERASGKFVRLTKTAMERILDGEDSEHEHEMIEVWSKDPSTVAFTDLMNRALDKPKEQEQDVNVKGDLVMRWSDE